LSNQAISKHVLRANNEDDLPDQDGLGIVIDDFSMGMSVIPEPTSALVWTMIGLVGLLAGFRRPRR
jgi:hypothetical protein